MYKDLDLIIADQNIKKKHIAHDDYGLVTSINHLEYVFEKTKIFDGELPVFIPTIFFQLEDSLCKIKYPSDTRPDIIFSNPEGDTNFCFSKISFALNNAEEMMQSLYVDIKTLIRKTNPSIIFLKPTNTKEPTLFHLEFLVPTLDEDIYNYLFLVSLANETTSLISFNCRSSDQYAWKSTIYEWQKLTLIDFKRNEEEK